MRTFPKLPKSGEGDLCTALWKTVAQVISMAPPGCKACDDKSVHTELHSLLKEGVCCC